MSKDIHIYNEIKEMTQIDGSIVDAILNKKSGRRTLSFHIIANDNLLEGL